MKLTIPYNVTGKARKRLAEDVSVALNTIRRYLGTPTMSYQIGDGEILAGAGVERRRPDHGFLSGVRVLRRGDNIDHLATIPFVVSGVDSFLCHPIPPDYAPSMQTRHGIVKRADDRVQLS